jgi:signal peptidase I
MEPTLQVGDHLLVNKFIYGIKFPLIGTKYFQLKKPQRGDIIVFIYPKDRSKDFIKRVIGTEGEKVEIIQNKIYINDKKIDDPWGRYDERSQSTKYLHPMEKDGPFFVPKGFLFVLGDNRDNSQDSRFWGFVNVNEVKGKALIIYFSWDRYAENFLEKVRWVRFGKLIR